MRPLRFELDGHRSVDGVTFDASGVTVLFGKNNAGKTNILEAIHGVLTGSPGDHRRPVSGRGSSLYGGLWVELEPGRKFDDEVALSLLAGGANSARFARISRQGLQAGDPFAPAELVDRSVWEIDGPPEDYEELLFDGVRGPAGAGPRPHVLLLDWDFSDVHRRVEQFVEGAIAGSSRDKVWLESAGEVDGSWTYRVPRRTSEAVAAVVAVVNDLLPDFVEGELEAYVTAAELWGSLPKVILHFHERDATQCADVVELAGAGVARWLAASIQIALHLLSDTPGLRSLPRGNNDVLSGHVVLLDEPEAHLHPSAVRSVTRWCRRMASLGITVVVATHHEEFLRSAGGESTLVHVTRNADRVGSTARALDSTAVSALRDLAVDVGMHPAAALALHRAVLFVEGPLDVAVLEEYAGLRLDASGVHLVAVHGTKNLEGLISAEVVSRLGLRIGILTDATDVATMRARAGKRRSSEEKKVLRVLDMAEAAGQPSPAVFGVSEGDLLFVLPQDAIEEYRGGLFPTWKDLVQECRTELGAPTSQSVNWKKYASDHFQVPIDTPEGVRHLVRYTDLRGYVMPSLERVVREVLQWAAAE